MLYDHLPLNFDLCEILYDLTFNFKLFLNIDITYFSISLPVFVLPTCLDSIAKKNKSIHKINKTKMKTIPNYSKNIVLGG